MIGRRLAHYEVNAHVGSGGMGDVYRATDTKLGRTVALKFLREEVSRDPGRVARFRREARALASLNHPNIAAIHDQEEADGETFLVMEFVPGHTLEERIESRPLPLPESLGIALQIAAALETAHAAGVVHRDLKPANVKLTPDGQVKVLDFGLAKLAGGDREPPDAADLETASPLTLTSTHSGMIVGTPAYMSPEQAVGVPVDRRTDVFSFGCLLFEMLTGKRAFAGNSTADVVSRVLHAEPDWQSLPPAVPPSIERLLRVCLAKDRNHRRQSAGDVRIDLEQARTDPVRTQSNSGLRHRAVALSALAVALLAVAALAVTLALGPRAIAPSEMRLEIGTPQTLDPMHFAVSPDGNAVVYVASAGNDAAPRLYLRRMNDSAVQPLSGTENARYPFWSPDSRSVAFFAGSRLFRLDVAGGQPQALAPAANPFAGGAWADDGTILFSPTTVSPLLRVSSSDGGKPVAATKLDFPRQTNHRAPSFLPGGRRFLFYAAGEANESGIYLGSLDGVPAKRLTAADSAGVYLPPDRLLYVQQGKLVARRFDPGRGELSGDPVTLAQPVSVSAGVGWFSASATGIVAYRSGTEAGRRLTWFDSTGKVLEVGADLNAPALSADGRYLAYDRTVDGNRDVWIMDLVRGGVSPFTRHAAVDGHPVWSPDGSSIAFESQRGGTFDIWVKPSSGSAAETMIRGTTDQEWPLDWSRDGRYLLFQRADENYASSDLLALPMTGADRTPVAVADTMFEERIGSFSPDGRWVVYQTDESGRAEVVVKPFQRPGGITRVSTEGGVAPRWGKDGNEIYFIAPDGKFMTAAVSEAGSTLNVGKPAARFATHIVPQTFTFQYAVSGDGRVVVTNRQVEKVSASPITLLLNWKPSD